MSVLQFPTLHEVPEGLIGSQDLARAADLSYRQIDYWTRTDILRTALAPTPGSGNIRAYPLSEVAFALLLKQLLNGGMSLRPAVSLARQLLEHGHAVLAGIRIDLPQDL